MCTPLERADDERADDEEQRRMHLSGALENTAKVTRLRCNLEVNINFIMNSVTI